MKTFNEEEFKKALAIKDKQVLIDLICQYKWERDYFERKYKSAKKAVDLACETIITQEIENEPYEDVIESWKEKNEIDTLGFGVYELVEFFDDLVYTKYLEEIQNDDLDY